MTHQRGSIVKGPDVFGPNQHRPFVCLSAKARHPFPNNEGIYVAVTTTARSKAILLTDSDFVSGGLPKQSYASPWVVTTLKDADIAGVEGQLEDSTTTQIAEESAAYIGVQPAP